MLIDMDFSGAFLLFISYTTGETRRHPKEKNDDLCLFIMVLFNAFFYVFYEMAFFLGGFSLEGVFFPSSFGRLFIVHFLFSLFFFFALGVGVWKFALNTCILGFLFLTFLIFSSGSLRPSRSSLSGGVGEVCRLWRTLYVSQPKMA
ncbi:hypothetical protein HOY80DRAFT_988540 [Tuber brumale]|nr:hypothetical protein HOY80DRAFT_988540 [Tuber brumale]